MTRKTALPVTIYRLVYAYWCLWYVRVALKTAGMSWLRNRITLGQQFEELSLLREPPAWIEDLHESVRLASRLHRAKAACLPRSLVLAKMLSARNVSARVVIGVSKDSQQLNSHAWVQIYYQGQWRAVGEPQTVEQKFKPI